MSRRRAWTRDELLVAFNLYCRLSFGQLRHGNKDVIALAKQIDRSPSAVSMKLCNFASFDPIHQVRGVSGLGHAAKSDKEIFEAFNTDWTTLAIESEDALARLGIGGIEDVEEKAVFVETEVARIVQVRRVQGFFRRAVMASYEFTCAICRINVPALVQASHIIPWRDDESRRADPHNGIALCTLHDRAFDRGFVTFDEKHQVLVSKSLRTEEEVSDIHRITLLEIEGQTMMEPERFGPDAMALEYHRENIFVS
jgi:putative restriction endonuclease